jgi:hypothetical protein
MNPRFFFHYQVGVDLEPSGRIDVFFEGEPVLAARSPDILLAFLEGECARRGLN